MDANFCKDEIEFGNDKYVFPSTNTKDIWIEYISLKAGLRQTGTTVKLILIIRKK